MTTGTQTRLARMEEAATRREDAARTAWAQRMATESGLSGNPRQIDLLLTLRQNRLANGLTLAQVEDDLRTRMARLMALSEDEFTAYYDTLNARKIARDHLTAEDIEQGVSYLEMERRLAAWSDDDLIAHVKKVTENFTPEEWAELEREYPGAERFHPDYQPERVCISTPESRRKAQQERMRTPGYRERMAGTEGLF